MASGTTTSMYIHMFRVQRREMGPLILHPSCKNHVRQERLSTISTHVLQEIKEFF